MIESKGWDGVYRLCYADGSPVGPSDNVVSNNVVYTITGGSAPHKSSSSGCVYVSGGGFTDRQLYAHVFGMKWVKI